MEPVLGCYYPTTLMLIDDDAAFLKTVSMTLDAKTYPHKTFTNPQEALTFVNQDTYREAFINRLMQPVEDQDYGEELLGMYYNQLISEIFNPERFQQVSVAIIDYEMPGMNGLQACEQIKNPHVKKILLTGAADESIAVEAFNKGLIYQYIRKHKAGYMDSLNEAIRQAQQQYFKEISATLLDALANRSDATALIDPTFTDYFQTIIDQNNISEYYLADPTGTFLMVDREKNLKSLFTFDDGAIEAVTSSGQAESLPRDLFEKLKTREQIICYFDPFTQRYPEGKVWVPYFRDPDTLKGAKGTYYTHFGDNLIKIDQSKVAFFKNQKG